jgi:hypothetical protein
MFRLNFKKKKSFRTSKETQFKNDELKIELISERKYLYTRRKCKKKQTHT